MIWHKYKAALPIKSVTFGYLWAKPPTSFTHDRGGNCGAL